MTAEVLGDILVGTLLMLLTLFPLLSYVRLSRTSPSAPSSIYNIHLYPLCHYMVVNIIILLLAGLVIDDSRYYHYLIKIMQGCFTILLHIIYYIYWFKYGSRFVQDCIQAEAEDHQFALCLVKFYFTRICSIDVWHCVTCRHVFNQLCYGLLLSLYILLSIMIFINTITCTCIRVPAIIIIIIQCCINIYYTHHIWLFALFIKLVFLFFINFTSIYTRIFINDPIIRCPNVCNRGVSLGNKSVPPSNISCHYVDIIHYYGYYAMVLYQLVYGYLELELYDYRVMADFLSSQFFFLTHSYHMI